jgi:hypothetical protein
MLGSLARALPGWSFRDRGQQNAVLYDANRVLSYVQREGFTLEGPAMGFDRAGRNACDRRANNTARLEPTVSQPDRPGVASSVDHDCCGYEYATGSRRWLRLSAT